MFPVNSSAIESMINNIDPVKYSKTRNFIDGAVTKLSPYLSRGFLTLPQVKQVILSKGYKSYQVEKLLQELAWREYFQRVWEAKGNGIFGDLKQAQPNYSHQQVPTAITNAETGIDAIDSEIQNLYKTGYLHNHVRMYVAGIACNLSKAHWLQPARWMYYNLLDGDLASNSCSWQWVAGSFSSKKYIANQENVNYYLKSDQRNTFLDHPYETILEQKIPEVLRETAAPELFCTLPETDKNFQLEKGLPLAVYTSYWLNPNWRANENINRVLLLEPSHFNQYPVSEKVISFVLSLARENIPGIQVFVGEFDDLKKQINQDQPVYFLSHPLHRHFSGTADPYPWMFPAVTGYYPSFFAFWKKAQKYV